MMTPDPLAHSEIAYTLEVLTDRLGPISFIADLVSASPDPAARALSDAWNLFRDDYLAAYETILRVESDRAAVEALVSHQQGDP